jgi:hypothetical protein
MKLHPHRITWAGGPLGADEFGLVHMSPAPEPHGIAFHCRGNPPRPRICQIPMRRGEAKDGVFGWDGDTQEPTLTPSIGCDARCGWHGRIIKGDWTP